jgi:hypothetical protein
MKLTLEPTNELQTVDGVPCRVWRGRDEGGTWVLAWVRTVQPQTADAAKLAAFESELMSLPQPVFTGAISFRYRT